MKIIGDSARLEASGSVVSIGMFDGVHRGHRRVLQTLRETGAAQRLPTVVVTFDPHPRAVLRPDRAPALLVSVSHRLDLLALTGAVDHCLVLPFDKRVSDATARDFIEHTLVQQLGMRALVVGENFRCGRGRGGDIALLRTLGAEFGFAVHPIALRDTAESSARPPCSSTEMRRLIESGDIVSAATWLTRPHEMRGIVSTPIASNGRVVEVALSNGMCTPAAADYAGAVRHQHRAASVWVPALLQVRHAADEQRRTVRLVTHADIGAAHGDVLALRFLDRSTRHATTA